MLQTRRLRERRFFHLERQDAPSGLKMGHYRTFPRFSSETAKPSGRSPASTPVAQTFR